MTSTRVPSVHSDHTPRTRTARNRPRHTTAMIGLAGGIVILPIGIAVGGAAAGNEFPPNPAATIQAVCASTGPQVTITYTNATQNATDATFTTNVGYAGKVFAQPDVTVAPNDQHVEQFEEGDGGAFTFTVSSPGMTDVVSAVTFDCRRGAGTIELLCTDSGPVVHETETNTGPTVNQAEFWIGGFVQDFDAPVKPGQTVEHSYPVAEDAVFDASVRTRIHETFSVPVAQLQGTADCRPPATIPSSTLPDVTTTAPATTVPTTMAPTPTTTLPAPSEPSTPTQVESHSPSTTMQHTGQLPVTGGSTAPIGVLGGLFVSVGLAIVRIVRRSATR